MAGVARLAAQYTVSEQSLHFNGVSNGLKSGRLQNAASGNPAIIAAASVRCGRAVRTTYGPQRATRTTDIRSWVRMGFD